jgi:tetratricopeptide (TPR) repeat protein
MDNLEYIDNFFQSAPSAEQTRLFEQKILEDAEFARDVSLYLSARQIAKESATNDSRERFRVIYQQMKVVKMTSRRRTWLRLPYVAAAAVIIILAGIFLGKRPLSVQQLANKYISQELNTVDVTMGKADDLQKAADLYNGKQYVQALTLYQKLANEDSTNTLALENAGKASIQLGQFDLALSYFRGMERQQAFANPGKFLEALTLMKRDGPGDKEEAKKLLEDVVREDLDKKQIASEWLKKW